jgi:hypothetical protein
MCPCAPTHDGQLPDERNPAVEVSYRNSFIADLPIGPRQRHRIGGVRPSVLENRERKHRYAENQRRQARARCRPWPAPSVRGPRHLQPHRLHLHTVAELLVPSWRNALDQIGACNAPQLDIQVGERSPVVDKVRDIVAFISLRPTGLLSSASTRSARSKHWNRPF